MILWFNFNGWGMKCVDSMKRNLTFGHFEVYIPSSPSPIGVEKKIKWFNNSEHLSLKDWDSVQLRFVLFNCCIAWGVFYPTSDWGWVVWIDKSLAGLQKLPVFKVTVGIRFICRKKSYFRKKIWEKKIFVALHVHNFLAYE